WLVLVFFQAEDGIRDWSVTGVQTCALPILSTAVMKPCALVAVSWMVPNGTNSVRLPLVFDDASDERCLRWSVVLAPGSCSLRSKIGRASCRERGESSGWAVALNESR